MSTEVLAELVELVQKTAAEGRLEDCEKADLWAFAKAYGLAEPSEWPRITKDELIARILAWYAEQGDGEPIAPEAATGTGPGGRPAHEEEPEVDGPPGSVVYRGPLSRIYVPGLGVFTRGKPRLVRGRGRSRALRLPRMVPVRPARSEVGDDGVED